MISHNPFDVAEAALIWASQRQREALAQVQWRPSKGVAR